VTSRTSGGLIKFSFSCDEELLADIDAAAEEEKVPRSVQMRKWLRMGRDEDRRRQELLRRDRETPEAGSSAA
jgi:hypothetical protein